MMNFESIDSLFHKKDRYCGLKLNLILLMFNDQLSVCWFHSNWIDYDEVNAIFKI
jgi:hypothetical protein